MSKKHKQPCEGCGLIFPIDSLTLNNELELTCVECLEEAKRDKRVSCLLIISCGAIAFTLMVLLFNHCSK